MMTYVAGGQEGLIGKLGQPVVISYLAYASEQLIAEGRAADEQEGIAIAITELLEFFLNRDIDHNTYTVDQFIVDLASFVRDNLYQHLCPNSTSLTFRDISESSIPDMTHRSPLVTSS